MICGGRLIRNIITDGVWVFKIGSSGVFMQVYLGVLFISYLLFPHELICFSFFNHRVTCTWLS